MTSVSELGCCSLVAMHLSDHTHGERVFCLYTIHLLKFMQFVLCRCEGWE